jgi:hypothetical protein
MQTHMRLPRAPLLPMKISSACAAFVLVWFPLAALSAEKPSAKEEMKALILEDAKKAAKTPPLASTKTDKTAQPAAAKTDENGKGPAATIAAAAPTDAKAPTELEGKLPQVEVNKSKVTQLDHDLHEQDRKMAFEAKNTKATELDSALNSPAATPTILGGYSTKVRTGVAQERIELMEFEKELTESIARAKTKEEKAALKKQLDDIRTMRRTLDSSGEEKSRAGR